MLQNMNSNNNNSTEYELLDLILHSNKATYFMK